MNAPMQLPAYLQNQPSRQLAQTLIGNLGSGSPPYISIKGNRFTLIDATGAEEAVPTYAPQPDQFGVIGPYLDGIIIDLNEHTSKVYYDKPYDPSQEGQQPACWSDNGVAPSRGAQMPQAATCGTCQMNFWGSATSKISGKGVKACHDVQKIAVQIPGDDVIFLLRVPPNSRNNLRDYTLKFAGQAIDMPDVITRISFDQQTLGTLRFVAVGFIPEAEMHRRNQFLTEKKTDALVGRTDQPIQGAIAGPVASPAALPPAQPTGQVQQPVQAGQFQPAPFAPPAANPQPMPSTGQQAGFAGAAAPSASGSLPFAAPAAATIPPQTTAAPSAAAAPTGERPKRQRRTKAQIEADNAAAQSGGQPAAPQGAPVAPFRPDAPAQPAGFAPAPGANFGIQPGVAPNPELTGVLQGIFGK